MTKPLHFILITVFLIAISINAKSQTDPFAEAAPKVKENSYQNESLIETKDMFDLVFEYPCAVGDGEAGVECDGNYIYTTKWNGNEFYKYDIYGTFIETFTIDGVSNIRDLAWDGNYFYGSAASTTVFQMDFNTQTLISSFMAPTEVRAIAYNDDDNTFYANNWSSDIIKFDFSGGTLGSFACGPVGESYYGLAFDQVWGQILWGYAQTGNSENIIIEIQLPDGTETGLSYDLANSINIGEGLAGGLCYFTFMPVDVLCGVCQNTSIWALELYPWSVTPNNVGVESILQPASGVMLTSEEEVTIRVRNYGGSDQNEIPVSFSLNGGDLVWDTIITNLELGDFVDFTFDTLLDLSNPSIDFIFEACTFLEIDEDPANDCKTKTITVPPMSNTLEGYVTIASNGYPIDGAMVSLASFNSITGPDGYFYIEGIPEGTHDVFIYAGDFCPWDTTITFASNQTISIDIALHYALFELSDDTLEISLYPDMTAYLYFDIYNPGTCEVDFVAGSDVGWLGYPITISGSLYPGEFYSIGWFMGSANLTPGQYEGNIIFDSWAVSSPDSIHVMLDVLSYEPPSNLSGYIECTDICIEWDMPTMGNPLFFNIYRDGSLITNFSGLEFCDQNLVPGTEYCYKVTAVYESGESEPSNEFCTTILMPENLEPTNPGCTHYENGYYIYWEPSEACLSPEGYNLYRNGELLNPTPLNDLSFFDLNINPGFYEYSVSASYYFGESQTVIADCLTGIEESKINKIEVIPNPVKDWFVVRSNDKIKSIRVYDCFGSSIFLQQVVNDEVLVDFTGQPTGIYLLKVETENGIFTEKIIVQ